MNKKLKKLVKKIKINCNKLIKEIDKNNNIDPLLNRKCIHIEIK